MPSDLRETGPRARSLHPASLMFSIGSATSRLLFPAIVVLFASRGSNYEIWLAVFFVPAVLAALARYWSYRYRFGPDELIVREGIITRNERHVPYARIQNIDLVQNPLHRLLKVAEVRLETAGGDKPEAVMRVLSLDNVEEMRDHVFAERRRPATPEPGRPTAEAPAAIPAQLLYRMGPRELVLFGIISNQGMVVVAALMGLLWQLDAFDRLLDPLSKQTLEQFPRVGWARSPLETTLLALAGLVAIVVVLRLLSIAWAFLSLHGFRLQRIGADLRAQYGLLTRVTKTTPGHRVQLISVRETALHRLFGRAAVQIETAGSIGEEGATSNRLWLAPLVRREDVGALVREALPEVDLESVDWQPIADRAWLRLLRRSLGLLALLAGGGFLATGPWGLLPAALLAPLALFHARMYPRHTAYGLTGGAVVYRSGWWVRRTSAARFSKIQALELTQSPFDRRQSMASLRVDTAGAGRIGHAIAVAFLDAGVASQLRDRLSHEAGRTAFHW